MIKTENIARALVGLVKDDGRDPKEVVDNFVGFAKKHNMESRVKNVLDILETWEDENKKRNTIFIKTARIVPEKLIVNIKKHLNLPDDAPVNVSVDEGMLGGFRVSYKDKLYEYGLKLRFNKLRTHLHSNHLK